MQKGESCRLACLASVFKSTRERSGVCETRCCSVRNRPISTPGFGPGSTFRKSCKYEPIAKPDRRVYLGARLTNRLKIRMRRSPQAAKLADFARPSTHLFQLQIVCGARKLRATRSKIQRSPSRHREMCARRRRREPLRSKRPDVRLEATAPRPPAPSQLGSRKSQDHRLCTPPEPAQSHTCSATMGITSATSIERTRRSLLRYQRRGVRNGGRMAAMFARTLGSQMLANACTETTGSPRYPARTRGAETVTGTARSSSENQKNELGPNVKRIVTLSNCREICPPEHLDGRVAAILVQIELNWLRKTRKVCDYENRLLFVAPQKYDDALVRGLKKLERAPAKRLILFA